MTTEARDVLAAYEALDAAERQKVALEILRRVSSTDDISNDAFDELTAEVFRGYENEESQHRGS